MSYETHRDVGRGRGAGALARLGCNGFIMEASGAVRGKGEVADSVSVLEALVNMGVLGTS